VFHRLNTLVTLLGPKNILIHLAPVKTHGR